MRSLIVSLAAAGLLLTLSSLAALHSGALRQPRWLDW
jgi:hypothetical protein